MAKSEFFRDFKEAVGGGRQDVKVQNSNDKCLMTDTLHEHETYGHGPRARARKAKVVKRGDLPPSRLVTCQHPGDECPHGSFKPGDHLPSPLLIDGDDLGGNAITVAAKSAIGPKAIDLVEMIEEAAQLLVVNIKPSGERFAEDIQDFLEPLLFDEVRALGDLQVG